MIDNESNLNKPGMQKQKPPTYPRLAHRYIPIHTGTSQVHLSSAIDLVDHTGTLVEGLDADCVVPVPVCLGCGYGIGVCESYVEVYWGEELGGGFRGYLHERLECFQRGLLVCGINYE